MKRFATGRLEAFSDGVIAIIITIMVLELHVPKLEDMTTLEGVRHVLPTVAAYALSFVFSGLYWVAHHHVLLIAERVTVRVLWSNLHFLFWLSLVPFVTNWVNDAGYERGAVALYAVLLCIVSLAFWLFVRSCEYSHDAGSSERLALRGDTVRDLLPIAAYGVSALLALLVGVNSAFAVIALVLTLWFVPE